MTKNIPIRGPSPAPTSVIAPRHEAPTLPASQQSSVGGSSFSPEAYIKPFLSFMTENPTVYHAISHFHSQLESEGFTYLSERELWADKLSAGGKYFFSRNGSGLIAFTVGEKYKPGNGAAIIASHIDALTTKVKPVSTKATKQGFVQLGVAQYAGALNQMWFDRDLGIGGRVFLKNSKSGVVSTKLVKLDWPIARIPSIAPHFGIPAEGQANRETRMVPIIGLDNSDLFGVVKNETVGTNLQGATGTFAATQPQRLVEVIAGQIGVKDCKWKPTTGLFPQELTGASL